jgi:2-methylcitrate dehydratase PrpD
MNPPARSSATSDDVAAAAAALKRLTAWAVGIGWRDIPEAVARRAALVLVDDLSAIIAGRDEPEVRQLQDGLLRVAGPPEASLFNGRGARADRYTAAMANAASGCWCELDEGYRVTTCHAGIYVLPALLAEAEAVAAPVTDVLRCLAVAYEVATRIARGFPGTTRDLHPHGCFAAIGAAVGLGLLRGYDAGRLHAVLNTACCMVTPSPFDQAYRGALVRNVWPAIGAGNGMRAADWAALGITALETAPVRVFRETYGAELDAAAMTAGLGDEWAILSNFQRRHACCQFAHSAIESTLTLLADMPEGHTVDDLERVVVETHPLGLNLDTVTPTTTLGARFSTPHIVAATALLGHADVSAFSMQRIADPRIAALRQRVELRPYEPGPSPPQDRPARVTWIYSDGTERTAECLSARGEPGAPYTEAEILDKAASIAAPVYPGLPDQAKALLDLDDGIMQSAWRSVVEGFAGPAPGP